MSKEQVDVLPDYSAELASLGRGSLIARIARLEKAMDVARLTLQRIAHDKTGACIRADHALEVIAQILLKE